MTYSDGQSVMLGDHVDLGGGMSGIVVGVISDNQFAAGFEGSEWCYLKRGVLVHSSDAGLMHFEGAHDNLHLLRRRSP